MTGRRQFILGGAAFACGCVSRFGESRSRPSPVADACIRDGLYAGLCFASNSDPVRCRGNRTFTGRVLPVDEESLFDLASVGKTQTAALCALLVADGRLDPDAPFTEYLPEHVLAKENCTITVRDLATHTGGFDNSKPYCLADVREHFAKLLAKRPVKPRGESFCYACSNYVYLGMIVERLTGLGLDAAAKKLLWGPLGMKRTTWQTCVGDENVCEYPESTYGGPRRRLGEHNDLCAHYAGRPVGNGSCFSTGPDMLRFVTDLLERRTFPAAYYDLQLSPSAVVGGHRRSFGWDMTAEKSTFSDWTPTGFSDRAVCHTGWTGSAVAVDPVCGFAGIVLGNRLASKERTMGPRLALLEEMRREASAR